MRKFKIKNRPKRKYTKRKPQSVPLKPNPYTPIKTFAPVIPVTLYVGKQETTIHSHHQSKKTKTLLICIALFIIVLSSIILKPYFHFGYLYSDILITLKQVGIFIYQSLLSIQNITNENYKIICKAILTITYTINFTNNWIISQIILLLSATVHTAIHYWEKLTSIININLTQTGQELDKLSPPVKFILNSLQDSAQNLINNMSNIFKSLSSKNITITN